PIRSCAAGLAQMSTPWSARRPQQPSRLPAPAGRHHLAGDISRSTSSGCASAPVAFNTARPLAGPSDRWARPPPAGGPVLLEALASEVLVPLLPPPAASRHSSDEYSVSWEQEVCDDGRQAHPRWVPPRFAVPGYRRRQRRDRLLHQGAWRDRAG